MPIQSISTLKNWFRTALKPTQSQFWDWLDSYWHKSDQIPMGQVGGLNDALGGLASQESFDALDVRVTAIEAGGSGGGVAPTYYQEVDALAGNIINTANPLPTMSQGQKINLYRSGVRMRYLKDFTISGSTQIVLVLAADNEDFTLIYQS
jgi:hypothetical protein